VGYADTDTWVFVREDEGVMGGELPLEAPVMIASFPSSSRYPCTPPRFVAAVLVRRDSMMY